MLQINVWRQSGMMFLGAWVGLVAMAYECSAQGRGRPAPPPSRYTYTLHVDAKSLPEGVKIRESDDDLPQRLFLSNASETPLVIDEKFSGEMLVAGTKLVGGKVYNYFPSGVPMEGKQHLKGWQAPFGDIPETILRLARDPERIAVGREPGLGRELPEPEPFSIPAKYGDKPHAITGEIRYQLNPAYDAFYKKK
jgi:hypothetical protein